MCERHDNPSIVCRHLLTRARNFNLVVMLRVAAMWLLKSLKLIFRKQRLSDKSFFGIYPNVIGRSRPQYSGTNHQHCPGAMQLEQFQRRQISWDSAFNLIRPFKFISWPPLWALTPLVCEPENQTKAALMCLPSAQKHIGPKLESFFFSTCGSMILASAILFPVTPYMIFIYTLGVSARYLSAGLSGSIKRMTGGADRVSVAKTPPCSWIPKPVSGSPLRMTSLVSTWKTCPPGPTELDARDTEAPKGGGTSERDISGEVAEKWRRRGGWWETIHGGG